MSKAFVISAPGAIDRSFYNEMAAWTNNPQADLTAGINDGGAAIVSPKSEVLAGPIASGEEGIAYADLDLDLWIGSDRRCSRTLRAATTVPTLEVNRTPSHYEDHMAAR